MNVAKPLSLSSAKPAIVVDNNATRGINNIEKKNSKLNQEQQEEDEQQPQQQENDQQSEAESSWNNDDNWDDMDQSDNNETFNNSNSTTTTTTTTTTANIPEELMDESLPIELTTAIDDDDDFVDPFLRKQPARTPTKATKPKVNPLLPKPEDEIGKCARRPVACIGA